MSFQQGISGLNAASRNLEVIGNNIANANTVGAKVARAEFADIYANAAMHELSGAPGMGVRTAAVTQQFGQGGLRTTENPLDVAINGRGFFQVATPGNRDAAYTRNGAFQLDNQGYIVTAQGMRLQGYAVDAAGQASGVTTDIQLPTQGVAPQVSTNAQLALNLDGRTPAPTAAMPAFAIGDAKSYTASTAMTVYDQQGNEHVLSMYFRRTATDNQWDVYTALDGQAVPAFASGTQLPAGALRFGADGALDPASANLNLQLPYPTATLPVPPSASTTTAPLTLSFADSTQFGSAFGVTAVSQDGYAPGQLTGFAIDGNGTVQARYSNGQTLAAAQIALADFRNEQGLAPVGGNLWRATPASGQPAVGAPGSANLGVLQGGALEEANIDLTQQLVDMITAQRAYQANAQTIKTQDQMMSTLVNLR
jgi:flagellar hook protein FlgE